MTESQNRVFEEAKKRLKKKKWYRGVCMDNFPSDKVCRDDFEGAVNDVTCETAMWDDPNFYNF
jgi:hypothetical protein